VPKEVMITSSMESERDVTGKNWKSTRKTQKQDTRSALDSSLKLEKFLREMENIMGGKEAPRIKSVLGKGRIRGKGRGE